MQRLEAAEHQARSEQKEHGDRRLDAREDAPRRLCRPRPAGRSAGAVPQGLREVRVAATGARARSRRRSVVASVSTAAKPSMPASIPTSARARGRPAMVARARTRMPRPGETRGRARRRRREYEALGHELTRQPPLRPAPIEARTAISRCRPSARESSRFATLAQAMSIRNPTAPKTRTRARRAPPRTSSSTGTAKASKRIVLRIHALLASAPS